MSLSLYGSAKLSAREADGEVAADPNWSGFADNWVAWLIELTLPTLLYSRTGMDDDRMSVNDYKTVLYRQEDGSWVAEIPSVAGCYALMPTRESALAELASVFNMLADEYREKGIPLPADTTEIVHA